MLTEEERESVKEQVKEVRDGPENLLSLPERIAVSMLMRGKREGRRKGTNNLLRNFRNLHPRNRRRQDRFLPLFMSIARLKLIIGEVERELPGTGESVDVFRFPAKEKGNVSSPPYHSLERG
jgi:hypothetical protein